MRSLTRPTLLLVALAACSQDATVTAPDPALVADASAAAAAPSRPISGHCELTFNPPPFPLPPVHVQEDVGTCQFSHLGRTRLAGVQEIDFAAGTQTGTRTFTAANGDELYATSAGTSAPAGPGRVAFQAVLTFTGGTGRFVGATGQLLAQGVADLPTRTTRVRMEGEISY